ncbi:MAG: protease pro-enzyme activation domain-containing protein [Trebonia sp.]
MACAVALGATAFAALPAQALAAQAQSAQARAAQAPAAQALTAPRPQRVAVAGSQPRWAIASASKGLVPPDSAVSARVYLAGRGPAGLAAYAARVSEPGRAEYGHYLTPDQYEQRFGPTAAQVSAVREWLTSAGLRITAATSRYVAFSGTEAEVPAAFGTALHYYRVDGAQQRAPAAPLTMPSAVSSAVSSAVLTVLGLATGSAKVTPDTGGLKTVPGTVGALTTPANLAKCSRYWGQRPATGLPPAYGQVDGSWAARAARAPGRAGGAHSTK